MTNFNSLHLQIADELTRCAREGDTITYGELCNKIGYDNPRKMGAVLDPLTKLTYQNYGVFISVLVVLGETKNDPLPMPGDGFFAMYNEVVPSNTLSKEDIVKIQRESAYKQDWSELPELIRREIDFNGN